MKWFYLCKTGERLPRINGSSSTDFPKIRIYLVFKRKSSGMSFAGYKTTCSDLSVTLLCSIKPNHQFSIQYLQTKTLPL